MSTKTPDAILREVHEFLDIIECPGRAPEHPATRMGTMLLHMMTDFWKDKELIERGMAVAERVEVVRSYAEEMLESGAATPKEAAPPSHIATAKTRRSAIAVLLKERGPMTPRSIVKALPGIFPTPHSVYDDLRQGPFVKISRGHYANAVLVTS